MFLKLLPSPSEMEGSQKNQAKYHCTGINQEASHFPEGGKREKDTETERETGN